MSKLDKLIHEFGFSGRVDFFSSLNPAGRYHKTFDVLGVSITAGAIADCVELLFGMSWLAVAGLVGLLGVELATGIWASKMRGDKIESRRMGRFMLLIGVWLTILVLLFALNVLAKYSGSEVATLIVGFFRNGFLIFIVGQYLISILENLSVMTGKSNHVIIAAIRERIKAFLGTKEDPKNEN